MQIQGRDEGHCEEGIYPRKVLYRARIPHSWQKIEEELSLSVFDTRLPIAVFTIPDDDGELYLHVHSFPFRGKKIPPQAQVERWQRQWREASPARVGIRSYAHAGFVGLCFEAENKRKGEKVLAWAMQLAARHDHSLSFWKGTEELRGDYTIKVEGKSSAIARHEKEIHLFARSFELIVDLPRGAP